MYSIEDYAASPKELEYHLLSAIRTSADMAILERYGVTEHTFRDPECKTAYAYIRDVIARTGRAPSAADLKAFGSIERVEDAEDLEAAVQAVRNHEIALTAREVITKRWADLEEDPQTGLATLTQELSALRTGSLSHTALSDASAMDRLADQAMRKKRLDEGGVIGIPTGLLAFETLGDGWRPGELITVMGMTGIGKSWLLIYMGAVAYQAGYRVLFIEPELGRKETDYRIDSVLGRMNGFEFSNKGLLRGQYATDPKYEEWLRLFAQNDRWITADSSDTPTGTFTAETIVSLVNTYKPHLLMIDGFHLLGSHDSSLATWEQIKFTSKAVKTLSIRHDMAVIAAVQVQREAMVAAEASPEIYHGAYGKSLQEDSQVILTLAKTKARPNQRLYGVIKKTHGEPIDGRRRLQWEVDSGDIRELTKKESSGA